MADLEKMGAAEFADELEGLIAAACTGDWKRHYRPELLRRLGSAGQGDKEDLCVCRHPRGMHREPTGHCGAISCGSQCKKFRSLEADHKWLQEKAEGEAKTWGTSPAEKEPNKP